MKAIVTTGWGLKPTLTLMDTDAPERLKPDDVLVAVHAASVNPKDWKLNYHLAVAASPVMVNHLPPLFGDDLAGIVVDKGRNVRDFDIGDAVYGMDMRLRTASLAELARISQRRIATKNRRTCHSHKPLPCRWPRSPPCKGCAKGRPPRENPC